MPRLSYLVCASATLLAVSASIAVRADALSMIKARRDLMKLDLQAARLGDDMIKGTVPFDLAKAKGVFATFINAADKEPELFPPDSKTGDGTTASPKIWKDMAAFKAAYGKFGSEATAAMQATTDLASFKDSFEGVVKNCGVCHELYRVKKG